MPKFLNEAEEAILDALKPTVTAWLVKRLADPTVERNLLKLVVRAALEPGTQLRGPAPQLRDLIHTVMARQSVPPLAPERIRAHRAAADQIAGTYARRDAFKDLIADDEHKARQAVLAAILDEIAERLTQPKES
jgi:hypothetical protein